MSTRLLMEVGRRDVKIEIDGDGDRKLSVMDSGRLRPDLHLSRELKRKLKQSFNVAAASLVSSKWWGVDLFVRSGGQVVVFFGCKNLRKNQKTKNTFFSEASQFFSVPRCAVTTGMSTVVGVKSTWLHASPLEQIRIKAFYYGRTILDRYYRLYAKRPGLAEETSARRRLDMCIVHYTATHNRKLPGKDFMISCLF